MKYGKVVNEDVARIIYGTSNELFKKDKNLNDFLDRLLDMGLNTLDTARKYGDAEKIIGRWLKHQNRSSIKIISKCCHPTDIKRISRSIATKELSVSLYLLNTDYIDFYLYHRDDTDIPVSELVHIMNDFINEGKIRYYGVSNWSLERIQAANKYAKENKLAPITITSPSYSLCTPVKDVWGDCTHISGKDREAERNAYSKLAIMPYSALANGFLSGKIHGDNYKSAKEFLSDTTLELYGSDENYEILKRCDLVASKYGVSISQIALAYLLVKPNVFPIMTSSKIERIKNNISALNIILTKEDIDYLELK